MENLNFEESVKYRRSVRRFSEQPVADNIIQKCLELALLAPNSSNTQTWDFHWVKPSSKVRTKLAEACMSQSAARTSQHMIVVTANSSKWKRSQKRLIDWVVESKTHPTIRDYYAKMVPFVYTSGFFNILAPLKWLMFTGYGLFKPIMRKPVTNRDLQEIAIKSAALACENFVLSLASHKVDSCMMEGFDEYRVRRLLGLSSCDRVVMVIATGYRTDKGLWGSQFRLPFDEVVHIHD